MILCLFVPLPQDIINLKEPFALNETELYAREILDYLGGRGEFWRQQKPKGGG